MNKINSISSLINSLKISSKVSTINTPVSEPIPEDSSVFDLNDSHFQRHQLICLGEQSSQELLRLKKTLHLSFDETNVSELPILDLLDQDNFAHSKTVPLTKNQSFTKQTESHFNSESSSIVDNDDLPPDSTPTVFQTYDFTHYTYGNPKTNEWNKFCKTFETVHPELAIVLIVDGKRIKINQLLLKLHSTCTRVTNQKEISLKCNNLIAVKLILFALSTGQLFLRLNNVMDIVQCCCELRLLPLIRFFDKLLRSHDPLCLLIKLREYVTQKATIEQPIACQARSIDFPAFDFDHESLINELSIRLPELLQFPGTLDLTNDDELELLLTPRPETEKFLKVEPRCEYQTFRFVLNWYRNEALQREDQTVRLLKLIRFNQIRPHLLPSAMHIIIRCYNKKDRVSRMLIKVNEQLINLALKKLPINDFFISPSTKTTSHLIPTCSTMPAEVMDRQQSQLDQSQKICLRLEKKKSLNNAKRKFEIRQEFVQKLLKSCKLFNVLGSRSLITSYPPIYAIGPCSCLLLFGGFSSQIPYLSDQGKIMYHLQTLDQTNMESFQICRPSSLQSSTRSMSTKYKSTRWHKNSMPSILTHEWVTLMERLPRNLAHFAYVKLGHFLFILGGIDLAYVFTKRRSKRVKPIAECYCLDIVHSCWYRMKSMKCPRAFHAACLFRDHIYVFGGLSVNSQDNLITLNTLERFDLNNGSWRQVMPINDESPSPRMAFGMIKKGGFMWFLGGIEQVDSLLNFKAAHVLQDVWSFSPTAKQFQRWPSIQLKKPRAAFGCLRSGDRILVFGGVEAYYNEELLLRNLATDLTATTTTTNTSRNRPNALRVTSQVLSLHSNQGWRSEPSMCQARIFPCAVRVGQHLFVIGGKSGTHFYLGSENLAAYCGTYEILNQRLDRWIEVPVMFSVYGSGIVAL